MHALLPLLDGYEALGMADKGCEKREEDASMQVHPPRSDQPRPCNKCSIKSSTMKKWQWVADRVTPFSSGVPLGTPRLCQGMVQHCLRVTRLMGASVPLQSVLQVQEHI